jgi:NitT/TauT family transport system substrate-binding protein
LIARLAAAFAALLLAAPADAAPFKLIITETETPLVPNSVLELAKTLGYYEKAGVDVELERVQQTPSAVAALRAGEGDMANITFSTALQLVARRQMALQGVISPDPALPFLIAAKSALAAPKDLDGKVFGVARIGSADDTLSRVVLAKLGVDIGTLQYLAVGQPATRADALVAGRIDATAVSIGVWTAIPDKSKLRTMVDEADFFRLAPFVGKLNVVTDEIAKSRAPDIEGVVRGILLALDDFAAKPGLWVDAMAKARPDVDRATLEALAAVYQKQWSVGGGLDPAVVQFTTDTLYQSADFAGLRKVAPAEWIDRSFIDAALRDIGSLRRAGNAPP